jgi:putative hemolysin
VVLGTVVGTGAYWCDSLTVPLPVLRSCVAGYSEHGGSLAVLWDGLWDQEARSRSYRA